MTAQATDSSANLPAFVISAAVYRRLVRNFEAVCADNEQLRDAVCTASRALHEAARKLGKDTHAGRLATEQAEEVFACLKPRAALSEQESKPASVDTHPKGGDSEAAPFMAGAVGERRDAQNGAS